MIEVTVELSEDAIKEELGEDYDPDSYDEDSVDWLAIEVGNSMETIEAEDWNDFHKIFTKEYKNYVISDEKQNEEYMEFLEKSGCSSVW